MYKQYTIHSCKERHSTARQVRRWGYVGEHTPKAGEYYSNDFEWSTCIQEGEAAIARQKDEWHPPTQSPDDSGSSIDQHTWDTFHQKHKAARFFKEKRYLPLEFPILLSHQYKYTQNTSDQMVFNDSHHREIVEACTADTAATHGGTSPLQNGRESNFSLHVAEIGCGCGSALLPILKANPHVRVTACDISQTAVDLFLSAAARAGIDARQRITAFAYDAASEARSTLTSNQSSSTMEGKQEKKSPLYGIHADCMLMIFTLSALHPKDMSTMLGHANDALIPGGLLLFRDYGKYDMAQLRFRGEHVIDPGMMVYRRNDGTLAYFFEPDELSKMMEGCGFETVEVEYATTIVKNRKQQSDMKRVFVHGVFRKTRECRHDVY